MTLRALLMLLLAPSAAALAPDVPASEWCAWIPFRALEYVDDCQENSTAATSPVQVTEGCVDWCLWVPGPTWNSIEVCHQCVSSTDSPANATVDNGTEPANTSETATIGEPKPESAPTSLRGKSLKSFVGYPSWCSTIPWGSLQYVPDCRGYRGSDVAVYYGPYCASWCQWVPSPSWQYVSSCERCGGQPVGVPVGPYSGDCASWCQWVPMLSWQYTSGCSGCF